MTKAGKSLWRLFCVALIVLALAAPCFAADTATSQKINYDEDTTIHWLPNPNDSSERIILYCMNNKLHWPHTTTSVPDVPEYVEGYLTEKDFDSAEEYRECICSDWKLFCMPDIPITGCIFMRLSVKDTRFRKQNSMSF